MAFTLFLCYPSMARYRAVSIYWWQLMILTTAVMVSFRITTFKRIYKTKGEILTGRLKRGTTNEEAIDIGLLAQLAAVALVDAAAVEDAGLVGDLVADALKPVADGLVHVLGLLGGGDLAGADGPDGLVGDDDLAPVGVLGLEGVELLGDDADGVASLALLEALAAAPDHAEAVVGGVLGLGGDNLVRLAEDGAALRVAEDGPSDVAVLELGDGDLAGEGTVGLVEDVLGGNLNLLPEVLAGGEQVQGWGGDDNLYNVALVSSGADGSGRWDWAGEGSTNRHWSQARTCSGSRQSP